MAKSKTKVKRLQPKSTKKPARDELTSRLLDAVDQMQDMAPGTITEIHDVPNSGFSRTPWRMAVRFIFPGGTSYDDIFITLRDWRDDRSIERKVGADRLSRIQVRYRNKGSRGAHGEYTLSEIAGWETASSRATERVGVRDGREDSLINRYGSDGESGQSTIESLIVWFSYLTGKEIRAGKKDTKTKKDKSRRRL